MNSRLAVLLSAFCPLLSAGATDYYVAPEGSDEHPGGIETPWATIQHAADTIGAGDSVTVQAGDYAETVTVNSGDGSAGNYKSFIGSGATVQGFVLQDAYCWIQGFRVFNATVDSIGISPNAGSDHSVITNCTVEVKGNGLETANASIPDDLLIAGNTFTNCQKGAWLFGPAGGVGHRFYSNNIVRLRNWNAAADCDYLRITSGGNHRVIGNYFGGTTTNDVDTSTDAYHVDNIQVWKYSAAHGAVTNCVFAWNVMLDAINGVMHAEDAGGGHTFTNNVIGLGLPYIYSGEMQGQSPFNVAGGTGYTGTWIATNNTWFGYGSAATWGDCTNVIVQKNICLDSGTGYSLTGTTPGTGDYNCTHPDASPDAGAHDITSDPLVVNVASPLGADGLPWTADDGLRLQAGSPAAGWGAYAVTPSPPPTRNIGTLRATTLIIR